MKIVLDTNNLVSGLLSPYGAPAEIVRMVADNRIQLCYDSRIITEYRNVLHRPKFKFDPKQVGALLEQIEVCGDIIVPQPLTQRLPDLFDEPFLEVAITAKVEYLVTGNIKHFPKDRRGHIKVVSPVEFIDNYRKLHKTN